MDYLGFQVGERVRTSANLLGHVDPTIRAPMMGERTWEDQTTFVPVRLDNGREMGQDHHALTSLCPRRAR